jgi:hypothetical protein
MDMKGKLLPIRLDSSRQIPEYNRRRLQRFDPLFAASESVETLLENAEIYEIARELDSICLQRSVTGYHYTRAVRRDIETNGLQAGTGAERRRLFLANYGNRFTESQRERILTIWGSYFNGPYEEARNGKVWFNLTPHALVDGGADRLLTYFGGEVVYMPLTEDKAIAAVLEEIGEPLVVRCILAPERLVTFWPDIPWGTTWLSTYHRARNRNALRLDLDIYSEHSILPSQLARIDVPVRCSELSGSGRRSERWKILRTSV